jgi:hypothetical protein
MNVTVLTALRARAAENAPAPVHAPTAMSFQELFAALGGQAASTPAASPLPARVVVNSGDCLSAICSAQLKKRGNPVSQQ